jgi:predicted amidophosphoribosyltransferase
MKNRTFTYICELLGKVTEKVADFLIPKENKVKLLEALGPNGLFENIPRSENFDFETNKIKAIFNYKTILCRQAIWEIKYRANKKLIQDFSLLLYEYILDELGDLETFANFKNIILIPIPSSKSRTREKGFNQCILITRELVRIDQERNGNNFTSLENFLLKENDTEHQARVSNRKKRLENLKNTFSINKSVWQDTKNNSLRLTRTNQTLGTALGAIRFPLSVESFPQGLANHSFIIIDDVITTGATMNEAFRALKSAGINSRKIRGFALAH